MILIVDDKQENLFSLKSLLEKNQFEVDTAASGEEALKKLLKNSYSLLLLDVQMPGMDGFEVAEAVSGYSKTREVPIILLSAVNVEKEFVTRGYNSGCKDYLTKPIDADILLLKIKSFYKTAAQTQELNNSHNALKDEIEIRKLAELELNNLNQELQSLISAIPQIAFTTKPDGNIEIVNTLWYTYSKSKDIFPESYANEPSIADCWQIARIQKSRFETEIKLKNLISSEYRCHLLIITPVKKDNIIIKWIGTLTDINEQKSVTEVLERLVKERTCELEEINRQLEISNENLEQFASVASHDLKEPLRKIKTYSSFIMDEKLLQGGIGTDYIDKIFHSSQRMSRLIDNLLNYSTLSSSQLFEHTSLNTIVDEVIIDLELVIHEKHAILQVGKLRQLEIIPAQMRQVFQNIISNALKFSRKNIPPVITISMETVEENSFNSNVSQLGDFCRITIKDNGIGFDEQHVEKIFTLFQQLNSRSKYEGNGIGLAMVKKIVHKHHGIITATSKQDKGSKFIMVLPVKR